MQGGGAQGLLVDMDDEIDEEQIESMSREEKRALEEQFMTLYQQDPMLKQVLGTDPKKLTLFQKY